MNRYFKCRSIAIMSSAAICSVLLSSCNGDEIADGNVIYNNIYILDNNTLVDANKHTFEFSKEGGEKEIYIVTFDQGTVFRVTGDDDITMEIISETPPTERERYAIYKEDAIYPERTIYQYKYIVKISVGSNTDSKGRKATFQFQSFYQGFYRANLIVRQE